MFKKSNRTNQLFFIGGAVLVFAISCEAATVTHTWNSAVATTNASGKAVEIVANSNQTGNINPEIQFAVIGGGLAAGSYTASYKFLFTDSPDQMRNAFRGSNGDGSDFDKQISIGSLSLNQWYQATADVTITGADNWTGTFEIKPTIFGNGGDAFDDMALMFDDVNVTDGMGASVLAGGLYDFEGDTIGSQPSNTSSIGTNDANRVTVYQVSAVPEPSVITLTGLLGACAMSFRTRR